MFDTIDFVLDEHASAPVSGDLTPPLDDAALLDAYSQAPSGLPIATTS
jgi:hypothetical protein